MAETVWESQKEKLQNWQTEVQRNGLLGHRVLQLLLTSKELIAWENMGTEAFTQFYRFLFFVGREEHKRNMEVDVALQTWQLVLRGRFRLLDKWCEFVECTQRRVVTEDTWRQVWDFSRTVHEDLSNYDPSSAWAVMLDDFVEYMRQQFATSRLPSLDSGSSDFLDKCCNVGVMMAVMPRCGSKRRHVDVDTVTSKLSHMPMVSDEEDGPSPSPGNIKRTRTPARPAAQPGSPQQPPIFQFQQLMGPALMPPPGGSSPLAMDGVFASAGSSRGTPQQLPVPEQLMHLSGLPQVSSPPPAAFPDQPLFATHAFHQGSGRPDSSGSPRLSRVRSWEPQHSMLSTAAEPLQRQPAARALSWRAQHSMHSVHSRETGMAPPGTFAVAELMHQTVADALFQSPTRY